MNFLKIAHKKAECIGCALCTEVAPAYWQMNADGEARLTQPIRVDKDFQYAHGFLEDRAALENAENGCPVRIIRIR